MIRIRRDEVDFEIFEDTQTRFTETKQKWDHRLLPVGAGNVTYGMRCCMKVSSGSGEVASSTQTSTTHNWSPGVRNSEAE